MPRVATISGISSAILLVLICGLSLQVSAQKTATKFDEFGSVGHCDVTARLDNLAIQLQSTPNAKAHIISYAPPVRGEGLLNVIKDYLINTRGLLPRQIKTTYGGRNSDLTQPRIELWIVPKNAAPPEPTTHDVNVETFKGLLVEQPAYDDFGVEVIGEGMEGIGGTSDDSFADILNQQKNAIGYIVVYRGEDLTPGAWRVIAQEKLDYLKTLKVDSSRVKIIFGGHRTKTALQLWILPKDAPPPLPDTGPEAPLAKAVKAGDFYADYLGSKDQALLFQRLTGALSADKNARAFLVVRIEVEEPSEPVEATPAPPVEEPQPASAESEEPIEESEPSADLTKLVEKWRVELANTHKIGPDRFIVLFTTAREMESTQLSLWIVPKGQPLPDPNKEEEEEEEKPSP